ncbi:MAG: 3-beta hydroxysteroid dehydrogenase, partial [Mycobacterium sp.]
MAFHHDFNDFSSGAELDRTAIETLGGALAGSDRPLVVAGGILWLSPGKTLTDDQAAPPELPRFSEKAVLEFTDSGVR